MDFRAQFTADLKKVLRDIPWILAAWEGGSAATGRLDEYSDLDIQMICEDDRVEEAFVRIEDFLARHGIERRFRLPEPTWHGHSQCFYILEKAPPLFYLDLVVMAESSENNLLGESRHGVPVIWFDPKRLLDSGESGERGLAERAKKTFDIAVGYFDFACLEVRKQIARGSAVEAGYMYHSLIIRHLAPLLNLKYRPEKFDFGLRYAPHAYPEEVVGLLEYLLYPADIDGIEERLSRLEREFRSLSADASRSNSGKTLFE